MTWFCNISISKFKDPNKLKFVPPLLSASQATEDNKNNFKRKLRNT